MLILWVVNYKEGHFHLPEVIEFRVLLYSCLLYVDRTAGGDPCCRWDAEETTDHAEEEGAMGENSLRIAKLYA